jgi:hypothetical protein
MLDRSEHQNLFDPDLPAAGDDEPQTDTDPAATERHPRPARPRPSRPRSRSRVERPLTAALARRFTLRRARARPLLRYSPVAILVVLLLTHPAGCGRTVNTNEATRSIAATAPPAPIPPRTVSVATTQASVTPPRLHHAPPPHVPAARPAASRASAPAPAPVSSPVSAPPVGSRPAAVATPAASYTPSLSVRRPQESGGEFGFEH